jgi:Short C-terminal domain
LATGRPGVCQLSRSSTNQTQDTGHLEKLGRLHAQGLLTDEEFAVAKRKLLGELELVITPADGTAWPVRSSRDPPLVAHRQTMLARLRAVAGSAMSLTEK